MIKIFAAGATLALSSAGAFAQPAMVVGQSQENVLRTGTPIVLKTVHELTTKGKHLKVGDRFPLEVADAVLLSGRVVIPAGSPAVGEITSIRNKGMWGKSGNIESQLLYVTANGRQIRLEGNAGADKGKKAGAGAVAVSAIVFLPTGFFWTGTSAVIPPGTRINGLIGEDVPIVFAGVQSPPPMMVGAPAAAQPAVQPAVVTAVAAATMPSPVPTASEAQVQLVSTSATPLPATSAAIPSAAMQAVAQWRQASYSPGTSIAFIDAASVRRQGDVVRFQEALYYRLDRGTDHFVALREANCRDRSFRNISVSYYLGKSAVGSKGESAEATTPKRGTVDEETVLTACGSRKFGKSFEDTDAAAASFFSTAK